MNQAGHYSIDSIREEMSAKYKGQDIYYYKQHGCNHPKEHVGLSDETIRQNKCKLCERSQATIIYYSYPGIFWGKWRQEVIYHPALSWKPYESSVITELLDKYEVGPFIKNNINRFIKNPYCSVKEQDISENISKILEFTDCGTVFNMYYPIETTKSRKTNNDIVLFDNCYLDKTQISIPYDYYIVLLMKYINKYYVIVFGSYKNIRTENKLLDQKCIELQKRLEYLERKIYHVGTAISNSMAMQDASYYSS